MIILSSPFELADYLLLVLVAVSIFTDIKYRRIFNIVLLPFALTGLLINYYYGGAAQLMWSIKGLLLGMALLLIPFALGGMGAGDVKLLGTVGAIKGISFVLSVFLTGALAGGLVSLFLLIRSGKIRIPALQPLLMLYPSIFTGAVPAGGKDKRRLCFPYALAIGCGVLLTYLNVLPFSLR